MMRGRRQRAYIPKEKDSRDWLDSDPYRCLMMREIIFLHYGIEARRIRDLGGYYLIKWSLTWSDVEDVPAPACFRDKIGVLPVALQGQFAEVGFSHPLMDDPENVRWIIKAKLLGAPRLSIKKLKGLSKYRLLWGMPIHFKNTLVRFCVACQCHD